MRTNQDIFYLKEKLSLHKSYIKISCQNIILLQTLMEKKINQFQVK